MGTQSTAIYPGSFDPITKGHMDIICRALKHFETVYVVVGNNSRKQHWLSWPYRRTLAEIAIKAELGADAHRAHAVYTDKMMVDFARERGASVIIRGLRTVSDFDSEFVLGMNNMQLDPGIDTVFMLPQPEHHFTSSSSFREIFRYSKERAKDLIPESVYAQIKEEFQAP